MLAPTHTGTQPASYSVDGKTIRPLGDENDKAFALVNALDADQQKQAILELEVRNLVLGPGTDGKTIAPEGVRASSFTPAAAHDARGSRARVGRHPWRRGRGGEDEGDSRRASPRPTSRGRAPTTNGKGAYFRIQGPAVLIEYAPQGQADNNTDHIHTIYRDPTNDYAAKASQR